jgi:hypothetical protein
MTLAMPTAYTFEHRSSRRSSTGSMNARRYHRVTVHTIIASSGATTRSPPPR